MINRVADSLDRSIFVHDWTAREELELIEQIQKWGVGNWKIISEQLGTGKSTKNCEEHYWELYMGRFGKCIPLKTLKDDGTEVLSKSVIDEMTKSIRLKLNDPFEIEAIDSIPVTFGHECGEEIIRDKGKDTSKGKERQELRERQALLPGADLPGFMPLREDFDVEHENDAEVMLADMEFSTEDHPTEKQLKLDVIGIYNSKLDERNKRKRFVIDRGLVDFKRQQNVSKVIIKGRIRAFL